MSVFSGEKGGGEDKRAAQNIFGKDLKGHVLKKYRKNMGKSREKTGREK